LSDRTHADSLTAKWNREIDERLNLSHYWQQDDLFAVRVNFKQGILYFEITDKPGRLTHSANAVPAFDTF